MTTAQDIVRDFLTIGDWFDPEQCGEESCRMANEHMPDCVTGNLRKRAEAFLCEADARWWAAIHREPAQVDASEVERVKRAFQNSCERTALPLTQGDIEGLARTAIAALRSRPAAKGQWVADESFDDADRILAMTDEELDTEIRATGEDPARVNKWAKATGRTFTRMAELYAEVRALRSVANGHQWKPYGDGERMCEVCGIIDGATRGWDRPCKQAVPAGAVDEREALLNEARRLIDDMRHFDLSDTPGDSLNKEAGRWLEKFDARKGTPP